MVSRQLNEAVELFLNYTVSRGIASETFLNSKRVLFGKS